MSETPPAGWYPDPQDAKRQRYWDGTAWTEHTAEGSSQAASAAGHQPATTSSGAVPGSGPNTWTWQSIVATILCCAPIAVAGALNAGRAEAALKAGDHEAAATHSRRARTWTLWAAGIGLVLWIGVALVSIAAPAFFFSAASNCADAEPGSVQYEFCVGLCEGDVRGTPFEEQCENFVG